MKKYITYGLIGGLAGSFAIALSLYTNAQQPRMMHDNRTNMMHHSSSGHEMHDMSEMAGSADSHSQHSEEMTQVKLTVAENIAPNQSTSLILDVQNGNGSPIADFDRFQEKLMHLIVVSDDFQVFEHIHPDYQGNGRFAIQAILPQPGSYTLFSDYKPANEPEVVSVLNVTVPGTPPQAPAVNLDRSKTIGAIQATLDAPSSIQAGQEVTVTFNLKDASTNQPIQNLQPYLGEQGHLVILRQSPSLTRADYIHAHALENAPIGQVRFSTTFPEPGLYKLWGQFDQGSEIITADFWVNVQ